MPLFTKAAGASGLLLAAGLLGACSDAPAEPRLPTPASVEGNGANGQSARTGEPVEVAPAVVVRDGEGRPLTGVLVRFDVVRGGGSLARSSAETDASGLASVGEWTLGSAGVNEVEAAVGNLPPVHFTATALEPEPEPQPAPTQPAGGYDITVRYTGSATPRQQQAVANAVARWRSVITSDLANIPVNAQANACFDGQPSLNETVDDLLLFVSFDSIDGVNRVLGEAGPCFVRSDNSLPVIGHLRLDAADLGAMERVGTLDDVVLHEIGHVLGIGTLWSMKGLIAGAGGTDPHFTGAQALSAYRTLGGTATGAPIENTGGSGTRDGHWRESVFGNELMTGYIGGIPNPLSTLTIASLQDLGYGAAAGAANGYTIGGSSRGVSAPVDQREREVMAAPKYRIDRDGRVERIRSVFVNQPSF